MFFLRILLLSGLLFTAFPVESEQAPSYVIDSQHILQSDTTNRITEVLTEAAKRDVHIRVFIVSESDTHTLLEQWKARNSVILRKTKVVYLIINPFLQENKIVLEDKLMPHNNAKDAGFATIQNKIITPLLASNNVDRAAWEAVVACVGVMEEWSAPSAPSWLEQIILGYWKVIIAIVLLVFFIGGFRWFFGGKDWRVLQKEALLEE